jgi:glycopeptide antibiotics resistance protein
MLSFKNKNFKVLFKIIFAILFVAYLSFLVFLTFFSRLYGRGTLHHSVNMIPFRTILQYLNSSYNRNITITNILGNIEAFIPMGFLLPIVFEKLKKFKRVLGLVLLGTLSIEALQYITGTGASDIDDVILNVLGGIIGYIIYFIATRLIHAKRSGTFGP